MKIILVVIRRIDYRDLRVEVGSLVGWLLSWCGGEIVEVLIRVM